MVSDRRRMSVFHRVRPDALQALCTALHPNWCTKLDRFDAGGHVSASGNSILRRISHVEAIRVPRRRSAVAFRRKSFATVIGVSRVLRTNKRQLSRTGGGK